MIQKIRVKGTLFSGLGKGRNFVGIDWVVSSIQELMGFEPYLGTLNLKISEKDFHTLMCIKEEGRLLKSPNPAFCNALLLSAKIKEIPCAIVFPEETVWVHQNTLEVISPVRLRDAMQLNDGDEVEVEIIRRFIPSAIIFDVDGTLVDSIGFYFKMAQRLLEPYGFNPDIELLRKAMNEGTDPWSVLLPENIPNRDRLLEGLKKKDKELFSRSYQAECRPFSGVELLLKELKDHGLKLGIVTNTWDLEAVTSVFKDGGVELESVFEFVITLYKEGRKVKTIEEALKECLTKLRLKPIELVYVADGAVNISTAKKLGVVSVGVLTGVGKEEELKAAGADLISKDIKEFMELLYA